MSPEMKNALEALLAMLTTKSGHSLLTTNEIKLYDLVFRLLNKGNDNEV